MGIHVHHYSWFDPNTVLYPGGDLGPSKSTAPFDFGDHGTHTMGTMVGDGGTPGTQVGMAPRAKWVAISLNELSVLGSIGALAFSATVVEDYHARQARIGTVVRASLERAPSALVFMLVTGLLIVGLLVLGLLGMSVATIILPAGGGGGGPGVFLALIIAVALVVALVYLTMRWAPAYPVMIEEHAGWREALRRSWHLSADNVLRILLVSLLIALITAIVSSVLGTILDALLAGFLAPALGLDEVVASTIALALASVVVAPAMAVYTAVLYFDLRARRDLPEPPVSGVPPYDPYR